MKANDAEVASSAAVALGKIGGESAIKTLRQSLAGAPEAVRSAVAEGCILAAEQLLADGRGIKGWIRTPYTTPVGVGGSEAPRLDLRGYL